jgi:hypothetical protein
MKLKLKNSPEQVELIKAMGSRNSSVSREATETFAAFLGKVVQKVLLTAGTASSIYTDSEYDEDDSPSYPVDLYYGQTDNHIQVWSQSAAGGLPTSEVHGMQELKIATYRLDSAVSFQKNYARKARLDVVAAAIERLTNEVLIKQERNAWAVILKALAEASTTPKGGSALQHVISSDTANTFTLNDLNRLMTRVKRLNESYSGNTPVAPYSSGITHLYLSPEMKGKVRAFAFNPIRTDASSSVTNNQYLPDNVREEIFRAAGSEELFGVKLVELIELGVGKKYNTLFGSFGDSVVTAGGLGDSPNTSFANGTDEILVGVDQSRGAFIRPVARQAESGGTFNVIRDDQFNIDRIDKVGFYGFLEEGRVCIDARAIVGISV